MLGLEVAFSRAGRLVAGLDIVAGVAMIGAGFWL